MGKPMLVLTSITYAMKSKDLLLNKGISSYLERIPKTAETGGCGYGLYVPRRIDEAEEILRQAGIRILNRMNGEASM